MDAFWNLSSRDKSPIFKTTVQERFPKCLVCFTAESQAPQSSLSFLRRGGHRGVSGAGVAGKAFGAALSWVQGESAWLREGCVRMPPNFLTRPRQTAAGHHPGFHLSCIPETFGIPAHVGTTRENRSQPSLLPGPAEEPERARRGR